MHKTIAVLPGDGVGPEVTQQAVKALQAIAQSFRHEFVFKEGLIGACAIEKTGEALPAATLELCLQSDAVLLGAVGDPRYDNDPDAKVRPEQGILGLRKALQLFANVRPINTYPSLAHLTPIKEKHLANVDFVIYRELTGGIYFGKKSLSADCLTATDECVYTVQEVERIAKLAFAAAAERKKKLTLVDKANVLETSRLWRKVVMQLAAQHPEIKVEYMFVDNAAMQLVLNPSQFDVILTENMFGDILSDAASVLTGTIGMLPSASMGNGVALFEPIHGSYPQAAGKDIANPLGAILSAAMLLEHLHLFEEAATVRNAVAWTLENNFVTKDIDPTNFYFTSTIGELVADYIAGKIPGVVNRHNIELRKSTII